MKKPSRCAILTLDLLSTVTSVKGDLFDSFGFVPELVIGHPLSEFLVPNFAMTFDRKWSTFITACQTDGPVSLDVEGFGEIGNRRAKFSMKLIGGIPGHDCTAIVEVTTTPRHAGAPHEALLRQFSPIMELFSHPVFLATPEGRVSLTNGAFSTFHSGTFSNIADMLGDDFDPVMWARMSEGVAAYEQVVQRVDVSTKARNVSRKWWRVHCHRSEDGDGHAIIGQIEDVTATRTRETLLADVATKDELTGLHNRRGLEFYWTEGVTDADTCVIFADVNGLKQINDNYGHLAGDHALQTVAARLRSAARPSDYVVRLGGDEFVLIAQGIGRSDDAAALSRRLRKAACGPVAYRGHVFNVDASFGWHLCESAIDLRDALERADEAMYQNKRSWKQGANEPTEAVTVDDRLSFDSVNY